MAAEKVNFLEKVLTRIDRLDRASIERYIAELVRERREAEEALDQISEGILVLDSQGTVRWANRRAFLLLGFERIFKGRSTVAELVREPIVKNFMLSQLKNPDENASEEFNVLFPRPLFLRIHWTPFKREEERAVLLRIENITHQRDRSEEEGQIQRIEGLLRLAAGVAHEIGNPLNSIQIHIGLLKREIAKLPKEKQRGFAKNIDILSSETRRLDQIVRSFLRAARRPPLRFRKESINSLIEDAVEVLGPEIQKSKVRTRLMLDKKLPAFLADRDRLHQAFINLIKNAIEAMPRGGELKITTRLNEKLCFIRFEDPGEGIDEKDLPHIFESYYTTKEEGSGLGLAQVYQTLREHGGRIDVKSQPGKGSVFTLALPIRLERLSLPGPRNNAASKP